jgi:hypothetical protein
VDRIIDACEKLGMVLMLCIENANATVNDSKKKWRQKYQFYFRKYGGIIETGNDFWTDERIRDYVARKDGIRPEAPEARIMISARQGDRTTL